MVALYHINKHVNRTLIDRQSDRQHVIQYTCPIAKCVTFAPSSLSSTEAIEEGDGEEKMDRLKMEEL